jgi:hypothetical protein
MRRTEKSDEAIWAAVDKTFDAANELFKAAEKNFENQVEGWSTKSSNITEHENRLQFLCPSFVERRRLFKQFIRMAFSALFKGKAILLYKSKPKS